MCFSESPNFINKIDFNGKNLIYIVLVLDLQIEYQIGFIIMYIQATFSFYVSSQRYTYRVLQTIQMKLILLCVWAERAVLGSAKTALKFKYEI